MCKYLGSVQYLNTPSSASYLNPTIWEGFSPSTSHPHMRTSSSTEYITQVPMDTHKISTTSDKRVPTMPQPMLRCSYLGVDIILPDELNEQKGRDEVLMHIVYAQKRD